MKGFITRTIFIIYSQAIYFTLLFVISIKADETPVILDDHYVFNNILKPLLDESDENLITDSQLLAFVRSYLGTQRGIKYGTAQLISSQSKQLDCSDYAHYTYTINFSDLLLLKNIPVNKNFTAIRSAFELKNINAKFTVNNIKENTKSIVRKPTDADNFIYMPLEDNYQELVMGDIVAYLYTSKEGQPRNHTVVNGTQFNHLWPLGFPCVLFNSSSDTGSSDSVRKVILKKETSFASMIKYVDTKGVFAHLVRPEDCSPTNGLMAWNNHQFNKIPAVIKRHKCLKSNVKECPGLKKYFFAVFSSLSIEDEKNRHHELFEEGCSSIENKFGNLVCQYYQNKFYREVLKPKLDQDSMALKIKTLPERELKLFSISSDVASHNKTNNPPKETDKSR